MFSTNLYGQTQPNKFTIYGNVTDSKTGEYLIHANLIETISNAACISNSYGYYSITTSNSHILLKCSYVGYNPITIELELNKDTLVNIVLDPTINLQEVIITDSTSQSAFNKQGGLEIIPLDKVRKLPVFMGEIDILKTAQLLPGIQSGHEGSSNIFVRGGGNDQNLYLIDGVPVYSVTHGLGFFSVFNEDVVNSAEIYKGGFPARFHGRLSSVVDIKTKEGNLQNYTGSLTIGLLSAKFFFNGPIKKNKGSFLISGRRSYFDLLARPIIKSLADGAVVQYYFYDMNMKANYNISKKSRLYFNLYYGKDAYKKKLEEEVFGTNPEKSKFMDDLKWGNFVTSLRWNYLIGKKIFSNLSLSYTQYKQTNSKNNYYESINNLEELNYQFNSGISDINLHFTIDYFPAPKHSLKSGIILTSHLFNPGVHIQHHKQSDGIVIQQNDTTYGNVNLRSSEIAVYIEDKWQINKQFELWFGISFSAYNTQQKNYLMLEPRLAINYYINPFVALKASYARMNQNIHLLAFSTLNMPTDLWIPSTQKIHPESSDQVSLGIIYQFVKKYEFSAEIFFKDMNNLVEYKEGSSYFNVHEDWEDKIEQGKGQAYGIELMINKKYGDLNGILAYTWSKSNRQFESINEGKIFPFRFDRRHDLNLALTYSINERIDAGLSWVYGSGHPATMFINKYASYYFSALGGNSVPSPNAFFGVKYYPYRNNYRMPAFHHLDVNVNFCKKKKFGERIFTLGVYNIYNRLNAFYLEERNGKLYKVSLFPIMPFIRFTLKFN